MFIIQPALAYKGGVPVHPKDIEHCRCRNPFISKSHTLNERLPVKKNKDVQVNRPFKK